MNHPTRYATVLFVLVAICPAALGSGRTSLGGTVAAGVIEGVVVDRASRTPLPGVNVAVEGTTTGTVTRADGRFALHDLAPATYRLSFSMVGYRTTHLQAVVRGPDAVVDLGIVDMAAEAVRLSEIVVTPGRFSIMGAPLATRQVLSSDDIKNMSWADDVTRAVARLPGVSSNDYSSRFTIRGGEAGEVLLALDGMELYEPFHQRDFSGGLFSIVDLETIQGIELMTGGFPAAYGNRLSGVFNMRTKRPGQWHTTLGLSLIDARFYTDGTFGGGRGSYLLSARRGMLDVLFKLAPVIEEATIDQSSRPSFYDAMGKVTYRLSSKHDLSFHALRAGDATKVEDVSDDGNFDVNHTRYASTYGWLTLSSTFTPDVFSRTMFYTGLISHNRHGSFHKYEPSDHGDFLLRDRRDYSFAGLKQDWNWQASARLFVSGGYDARYVHAGYDYFSRLNEIRADTLERLYDFDQTTDVSVRPSGGQMGAYVSGRVRLLPRLVAEGGLRFDETTYAHDHAWSPRAGLAYAFSDATVLRGAWGYYYQSQFVNDLDVNHGNTAFDPAQLARHYVVGFEHTFAHGTQLRMEAYYKDLSHYSPHWQNLRDHLEMFPEARNDNALVVLRGAASKGVEFFLKRDRGGTFSWWLSYALAKAGDDVRSIQFDGLLTKRTGKVPRLNDQRHTVYADVNFRPNAKWRLSLSWQFYQGWPRTDYTYRYQALPNGDLHFYPVEDVFNGATYPAYHRLDLRINRRFDTRHGIVSAYLYLINLYHRKNLKKFDLDTRDDAGNYSLDAQGRYVPFHDDKYWFGFMPVLGASWEL